VEQVTGDTIKRRAPRAPPASYPFAFHICQPFGYLLNVRHGWQVNQVRVLFD
jgi:hypothetical protein